jgi:multidrug efflux pump subunit AcrB
VKISELSVKHYQFTVLMFAMLVALGITSWLSIPRGEDPTFPAPNYTIVAVYPGATPTDLEQLVVDKIEERVKELDDLTEMSATVRDGLATISVEFDPSVDADRKYDEVVREVNALRPDLPPDLARLVVDKYSSDNVNIVQVALVAERAPWSVLQDLAERLEERVESVAGVRGAQTWGFPSHEVHVQLDLGRLSELQLPVSQVLGAIGSEASNVPAGSVDVGRRRFNVKTDGTYADIEEVRNTVVGGVPGAIVRLRDVALVTWGYGDPTHIARWNGRRAVWVTATQQEGENIQRVRDAMWATMDTFENSLPAGVRLERAFDQAENVSHRLTRLAEDFAIALALVLVTLLPLGARASLVVMISIPLSLSIGAALLYATGFSVNQLSIVGAVIALGLLVDDSIVVIENIARFLREGKSRRDAAIEGTRQIGAAVLGSTATLVLAFVPLLFLPGLPGRYIRSLPITVIYTVLASLLVSVTIIPWLASWLLPKHQNEHGNVFLRWFERGIHATYAPVLDRAISRPLITVAAAAMLIAGSVALVPVVGFSLFPKAGTPRFLVQIETPEGASLDETDRAARFAERVVAAHPAVKTVLTNVGRDNPQIYYNVIPRNENSSAAQLFVLLDSYDTKRTPLALDSLRATLATYPGARIELREFENGPPIDAPIAMRLTGESLDTLRALASQVEQTLVGVSGTRYVVNPMRVNRTDLHLDIDRQKAGLLGVTSIEVDRTLRLGITGLTAGQLRTADGDEHDVVVRVPRVGRPTPEVLDRIYVASQNGAQIPLGQIARLEFRASPPLIQHYDRERSVTITSHVRTGYNTDRVTKTALEQLATLELPAGYRLQAAGEIESRQSSFGGIGSAVVIATFLILGVLVLEFRTFRSTLIIASVIPLGVVGGIVALWLTGNTLSFTAMIGFVALVGIEIKTSILLVDFTNQLRADGVPLHDAIRRAGEVRFLPIVLTTLTAIGGLLPLALQGSALYSPLAWVIIGGLVSSTLLARLVTPVVYTLLAPSIDGADDEVPAAASALGRQPGDAALAPG